MPKRSRLGQLAGLVAAGLVVCAPVAQAAEIQAPAPVIMQAAAVHEVLEQAPPGPVLDPAETDKANSQETKNKVIAGIAAAILLGLVILGRRSRSKKKKS
ncbi:hypothetical protein [Amycolatopsis keratiniphila]|uniref:Gram-positive cocci surface proteins LPxTG domain-containing protein n=1 Tax=Amycolatopsis keratiniphila subsp. keratiniphila TaxID=227715 RepID=A0A1W2LPI5_9PSEU|nr:hypothetical protein [Amycolatopsis keratiniphila]ONF65512.1 hypothetical protein AVR91_0226540 [Amycolatopsis keratiniphila subsp. keratiniphila]